MNNDLTLVWVFILPILILIVIGIKRNVEKDAQRKRDRELTKKVTKLDRGTPSERDVVLRFLKEGIPPITIYHDLYLEKNNGYYSQTDAVIVTKVGIIVFEIKDLSGWIYGNGVRNYWTQVLAYGKEKYRLYNPIKQNKSHIDALKNSLKYCGDIPFYSIIVFYGDCIIKELNNIPHETYIAYPHDVISIVNSILENNPPANYRNKRGVINILSQAVTNGNNPNIVMNHIENINRVLDKIR